MIRHPLLITNANPFLTSTVLHPSATLIRVTSSRVFCLECDEGVCGRSDGSYTGLCSPPAQHIAAAARQLGCGAAHRRHPKRLRGHLHDLCERGQEARAAPLGRRAAVQRCGGVRGCCAAHRGCACSSSEQQQQRQQARTRSTTLRFCAGLPRPARRRSGYPRQDPTPAAAWMHAAASLRFSGAKLGRWKRPDLPPGQFRG